MRVCERGIVLLLFQRRYVQIEPGKPLMNVLPSNWIELLIVVTKKPGGRRATPLLPKPFLKAFSKISPELADQIRQWSKDNDGSAS